MRSRRLKVLLDKPASAQTTADRATKVIKAAELIFADEMGATLGLARQNVGLITKTTPFDPSHCGVSRTIRTRSTLGWGAAESGRAGALGAGAPDWRRLVITLSFLPLFAVCVGIVTSPGPP